MSLPILKVWTGKGDILRFVHETQEHTKAVTSLVVSQSGDTLYSGSVDKTVRVCFLLPQKHM